MKLHVLILLALAITCTTATEFRRIDGYNNTIVGVDSLRVNADFVGNWTGYTLGQAYTPYLYIQMQPVWPDGTGDVPTGLDRPSGRLISNRLSEVQHRPISSQDVNQMHTYFGQLLTVDIINTQRSSFRGAPSLATAVFYDVPSCDVLFDSPSFTRGEVGYPSINYATGTVGERAYDTQCNVQECSCQANQPTNTTYTPTWSVENVARSRFPCDNFTTTGLSTSRAAVAAATGTDAVNYRLPINEVTHFIDMSWLYGNKEEADSSGKTTQELRVNSSGILQCELSYSESYSYDFILARNQGRFRQSGDSRTNKTPPLHAFHALFVLEHNRQCSVLRNANSTFSEDLLFNLARRKTIGQYQKIATREYLGALLGEPLAPYTGYKPDVTPALDVFFGASAYRYGHAVLRKVIPRMGSDLRESPRGNLLLRKCMFNPETYTRDVQPTNESNGFDDSHVQVMRGISYDRTRDMSPNFIDDVRVFMFGGGSDLFTTNINRGRDLGLPSYNDARVALNLTRKASIEDISSNEEIRTALHELYDGYGGVDNIDAYVGMVSEDVLPGSHVGELAFASIKEQFTRLRDGDRFWYENKDYFSESEIEEFYGTSLRDIIIRNFPDVTEDNFPTHPFFVDTRQLNGGTSGVALYDDYGFNFDEQLDLASVYRLSWTIDTEQEYITIMLQTQGSGWAGVGFEPLPNTMKGADIVLCRMINETVGECTDRWAQDVGPPTLDTDLGGTNDVTTIFASQDTVSGRSTYIFKRPVKATDAKDKAIEDRPMQIIFAFHPSTNEVKYHGPTRSAATIINFFDARRLKEIPLILRIVVGVLAGLASLYALFNIITIRLYCKHFHYQNPLFSQFVMWGAILGYISVVILIPQLNDITCVVEVWLLGFSYVFLYGSLFVKTWRIWRIVGNSKLRVVKITLKDILKIMTIIIIVELAYLILWTAVDRPKAIIKADPNTNNSAHYTCDTHWAWWAAFIGYKLIFLSFGVFLAIRTRKFPSIFNEAQQLGFSIYITFFAAILLLILAFTLRDFQVALFVLRTFGVLIPFFMITVILYASTMHRIFILKKGPKKYQSKLEATASTNSKRVSSDDTGLGDFHTKNATTQRSSAPATAPKSLIVQTDDEDSDTSSSSEETEANAS